MPILQLDDHLIKAGIVDMRRIGSNLVIIAKLPDDDPERDSRRISIKIGENETPEDFAEAVEIKCDKPLGRLLTQYIIQFVSKPENWNIINPSDEDEESVFKPKYQFSTFEEWQLQVEQSYHKLHKVVDDNMATAWPALEFILSVKAILHIKEITLPYIGIILGPPSGIKTLILELLRGRNRTFYSDNFNPRAMVSHAILPPGMNEGDQHMLLKMKNNIVLAPELATLFAKPEDELRELIAILTRVADGRGLESDTGLGHKGVTGKVMFVMGGAAVEIPPNVYRFLTTFGPKLFFFRLSKTRKAHDEYVDDLKSEQFNVKFQKMAEAVGKYLDVFESCPGPAAEIEDGSLVKISLEKFRQNDDDDALHIIVYLGKLLKHLRAVVWTREVTSTTKTTTQDRQKTETVEKDEQDFTFNTNVMEEQDRANRQNYNLSLGHALSQGRTFVGIEDIPQTVKVVLSTAPQNRYNVFAESAKERRNAVTFADKGSTSHPP